MDTEKALLAIFSHLASAVSQSLPSDDQIIMGHVRAALKEAEAALHEVSAARLAKQFPHLYPETAQ